MAKKFADSEKNKPFRDYEEFMSYLFAAVNSSLDEYLKDMKITFASDQGGYKNALYPDLEIAHDVAKNKLHKFMSDGEDNSEVIPKQETEEVESDDELMGLLSGFSSSASEEEEDMDEDLMSLFNSFSTDSDNKENKSSDPFSSNTMNVSIGLAAKESIEFILERAKLSSANGIRMPFFELCQKLDFSTFTIFTFACAVLSSTQTDYAGVFQLINENGGLTSPTIESAAKLYYGHHFKVTSAYSDMSQALEQLLPVLNLQVVTSMPFLTSVSPDKRMIDYLFSTDPYRLDENYFRYFSMLTKLDEELDPIMANQNVLDAMTISYDEGTRLFAFVGDEGSGRKFFVKHFCKDHNLQAIILNAKKLFANDYNFVNQAVWALTRECILTGAVCCIEELSYREEEKDHFFTLMDLTFTKLISKKVMVFTLSKDPIGMKDITREDFTEHTLVTPNIEERQTCWNYFSKNYVLDDDVDIFEMSTKFLFTPGKIAGALKHSKSLATMDKLEKIPRSLLFKGCNAQMSSELSQKATRVEAKFGFEDIVMNADQRETIQHAIEQMNFKQQVYDDWNYTKKYPYGRGLTVLLFGAPGTGKSMMAQVLAHELNLELYRVDLSKVVDKYVGETEKSLSMIFREAKKCNVVLFFDECDTIFAKRSDDGGSNQSSNNNKTALLLQEMEAYDGVCVLATNYKHNIDPAFFRRMKYIVEFQFPNPDTREMLWKTTVPKTTPLAEDVDFRFLAEKFEFAGGNIKNCILNAAFLAAADPRAEGEVHMRHYLQAIRYEFVKVGKVFTRNDFEPFADEVFNTGFVAPESR